MTPTRRHVVDLAIAAGVIAPWPIWKAEQGDTVYLFGESRAYTGLRTELVYGEGSYDLVWIRYREATA